MLSISPRQGGEPAAKTAAAPTAAPAGGVAVDTEDNDSRTAPRYPASSIAAITGLRFSPHGVDATLINISETGLLAEVAERLKPNSALTAVFEGTFKPSSIEGRVSRTSVSAMGKDGRLRYHVGISFTKSCPLDGYVTALPPEPEPEPAPAPAPTATAPAPAPVATNAVASLPSGAAANTLSVAVAPPAPKPAPIKAAVQKQIEIEIDIPLPDPEPIVRNRW